jgi:hypothetical protein
MLTPFGLFAGSRIVHAHFAPTPLVQSPAFQISFSVTPMPEPPARE